MGVKKGFYQDGRLTRVSVKRTPTLSQKTAMIVLIFCKHFFLSCKGFVNGTEGMEDVDPVEQNFRQAIEEEKAK